jgi:hypothetical protein
MKLRHITLLVLSLVLLYGCNMPSTPAPTVKTAQESATDPATKALIRASTPAKGNDFLPLDGKRLTDTLAKAGRPTTVNSAIDSTTFPYPVEAGVKAPGGYPIYLIECSPATGGCIGPSGEPLGSITEVAKRLTPIRNSDVRNPLYKCAVVCIDPKGNVVGAVSPEMQSILDSLKKKTEPADPLEAPLILPPKG